jgi:UDP-2,4-diacetamido-2,4,6-trideoxy-beta-L-altropyranose hydrolase
LESKGFETLRLPATYSRALQDSSLEQVSRDADAEDTLHALETVSKVDWLVVDHYALDSRWEGKMKTCVSRLMAIDDLANRNHACDLLVDQNLCRNYENRYHDLVPSGCANLLGPRYALLRENFRQARPRMGRTPCGLSRLLVFFGGSDPGNETEKALNGIKGMGNEFLHVDVVVGATNPHKHRIKDLCATQNGWQYHCQVENMAELMGAADLAIGAGGSTTWERCCLGLPAIVTILSENQAELTEEVGQYGALVNLGWASELKPQSYSTAITGLAPEALSRMSQKGRELVDGEGCSRVVDVMFRLL